MARHATAVSAADIQKALEGVEYPADREELVAAAQMNAAPDVVLHLLQELPSMEFKGPQEVMEAWPDSLMERRV